jgi:hypothetical protein
MPPKRTLNEDHIYAGEEDPPVELNTVHIIVPGKRKKARVFSSPYGVKKADGTDDHPPKPVNPLAPTRDIHSQAVENGDNRNRGKASDPTDPPLKKVGGYRCFSVNGTNGFS